MQKKYTPIMVMGNIFKKNGGVTKAIYHRANTLAKNYSEVIICTFQIHQNFEELVEYHKSIGNIDPKITVLNLYEDYPTKNRSSKRIINSKKERFQDGNYRYLDEKLLNVYRCFNSDGKYIMYESYVEDKIDFIDHFETPWNRTKKEIFDRQGNLRKTIYFNKNTNKAKFNCYFYPNGEPCMSVRVDENSGQEKDVFYHPELKHLDNNLDFMTIWLQKVINTIENPVIFIDKREFVLPFKNLKHNNLKKIFILHNVHLKTPYDDISVLEPTCEPLFNNMSEIDRLVVLTNQQYNDIATVFGHTDKMRVIPHFQPKVPVYDIDREPETIISLARYHRQKNLTDAIEVISLVKDKIPNIKYKVFGYGGLEKQLNQLIKEKNLQNNIFLMGFTDNPIKELQKSKIMLMTSLYEGSPLVINESLACGTPVISYDTKYGPGEVIRNGIDGIVTKKYDIQSTAKAIIKLIKKEKLYNKMSSNGKDIYSRYNEAEISNKWISMLEDLD